MIYLLVDGICLAMRQGLFFYKSTRKKEIMKDKEQCLTFLVYQTRGATVNSAVGRGEEQRRGLCNLVSS